MLLGIGSVILIGCMLIGYGLAVERARRGLASWSWRDPPDGVTSYLCLSVGAVFLVVGIVTMCVMELLIGLLSIIVAYAAISGFAFVCTVLARRSSDRRRRHVRRRVD